MRPEDWVWGDPLRDPIVSVFDVLAQINAKTPRPKGMPASRLPDRVSRPGSRRADRAPAITGTAKTVTEMDAWLKGRIASS